MKNESKRHFACSHCGQVYESAQYCVCPFCRSGVVNQFPVDSQEIHSRRSYGHFSSPNNYGSVVRSKVKARNPELIPSYPDIEMKKSINDYQSSPVIVDWLSFTVKLSDFRHCTKGGAYGGIAFPPPPVLPPITAKSASDIDDVNLFQSRMFSEYLNLVIRVFITKVLGFSYGSLTGRGFNFYNDSFLLFSEDGSELLGRVGLGGNADTVHFSISGSGCSHLFANRSLGFVHHWLANVLNVSTLSRCDLAADDFSGLWTCEAAEKAWYDDGFKPSRGRTPSMGNGDIVDSLNSLREKVFSREVRFFGSRESLVYWRVYNKKLEQGITQEDFTWYRSEVELKKITVDVLLNPAGYFVGLNAYAASILSVSVKPVHKTSNLVKRTACNLLSATRHCKKQYGRLVKSLVEFYDGDLEKVVSSLVRDDSSLSFPSAHKKLINLLT